jgi:hypothetical protein
MTTRIAFVPAIELANELGLPLAWLKAEAKAGRIPSLQVARRQMFDANAVRAVLAERTGNRQDIQGAADER